MVLTRVEVRVRGGWGCRWEDEEEEEEDVEGGLAKEGEWTTKWRADRPRDKDRDKDKDQDKDKDKDPSEVLQSALSMSMLVTLAPLALQHRAPRREHVDPWREKGMEAACLDQGPGGKMAMVVANPSALGTARKVCDRGFGWGRIAACCLL